MRRADRLFQIIQLLRRRAVTTAAWLARELEVSPRTIYRDVADLIGSGVPIEGEAGTGYMLRRGFDLPPLMFTPDEIDVVVLGVRIAANWVDPGLKKAAGSALEKIMQVLPEDRKEHLKKSPLFSPPVGGIQSDTGNIFCQLREAITTKRKITLHYINSDGVSSSRIIRPLCLAFFAPVWIVSGWCELRNAFRNFRIDRISMVTVQDETFTNEPGRTLDDFLRSTIPSQYRKEHPDE